MSWADAHIAALQRGETVSFRPRGNSMSGRVENGQLVVVEPVAPDDVRKGDVVLCRVGRRQYLHIVKAVSGERFLIGNNRGGTNGWIHGNNIYGRMK